MAGQLDCGMVYDRLDLFLDGELPVAEHAELRQHLEACLPCAGHHDLNVQLQRVVRRRCEEHAPPGLLERIRDHLASPAG